MQPFISPLNLDTALAPSIYFVRCFKRGCIPYLVKVVSKNVEYAVVDGITLILAFVSGEFLPGANSVFRIELAAVHQPSFHCKYVLLHVHDSSCLCPVPTYTHIKHSPSSP